MSSTRERTKWTSNNNTSPLMVSKLLFIFICIIDIGYAIKCYKCTVIEETQIINYEETVRSPSCTTFDESDKYIVDCKYSTMCLKTISTLYLNEGDKRETVTRGCAQQKETTQVFRNRQWEQDHKVREVYEEGCKIRDEKHLSASETTECYCRGELCNSTARQVPGYIPLAVGLLFSALFFTC